MSRTPHSASTDFRGSDLTGMNLNDKIAHGMRQARLERAIAVRHLFSGLFGR